MEPIFETENSYVNESESISKGNKMLYKFCEDNPLDNSATSLLAKIWIIGRSYAASPERRTYGAAYKTKNINGEDIKLNLNTGSNGTDSFFLKLSKFIIQNEKYEELVNLIDKCKKKSFTYDIKRDKQLLVDTVSIVLTFNRILRESIEKCDEDALSLFERKTGTSRNERNLKFFISFCSKFMHFHLPNTVYIIDSFSSSHAKVKDTSIKSYIYKNIYGETLLTIPYEKTKVLEDLYKSKEKSDEKNKEKAYINHVERCYAIQLELHNRYKCNITPRMVDNFLMNNNISTSGDDSIE